MFKSTQSGARRARGGAHGEEPAMPLFLLFIAIPLTEISLLVIVGQNIGLGPIIAHILITAIIGAWALRRQGQAALARLQSRDPMEAIKALGDGAFLVAAGLCLITPGFLTDIAGFALLTPPVRRRLTTWLASRVTVAAAGAATGPAPSAGRDQSDEAAGSAEAAPTAGPPPRPARKGPRRPDPNAEEATILRDDK